MFWAFTLNDSSAYEYIMLDLYSLLSSCYASVQEAIYANVVEPFLFYADLMPWAEDAFDGTEWLLLGIIQVLLIAFFLRKWEKIDPAEKQVFYSKEIRTDFLYTLFHRLGIFHAITFILFSEIFFLLDSYLHDWRFDRFNVESWWPGVTSIPLVSFFIYLVALDFIEYLYHRASHYFQWWWQLHILHHSQRIMTAWSDNRNHILDDFMRALVFALFSLVFGVPPSQYIFLVMMSQFLQSWQHANLNIHLGPLRYFLISPVYHRLHHAIGLGYESSDAQGRLGGCNFGILFPWWDILFRTAKFPQKVYPTGVRDLVVSNDILVQQWQGVRHALRVLFKKLGD